MARFPIPYPWYSLAYNIFFVGSFDKLIKNSSVQTFQPIYLQKGELTYIIIIVHSLGISIKIPVFNETMKRKQRVRQ